MTPTQRAAALRLAFEQWYDSQPEGRINPWDVWQAAALLRELAAEPVQEPECQYAKDVGMPEYRCAGKCQYAAPQQRGEPVAWMRSMQAEIECGCLVAWNASTYGHSKQDNVHPMFLSAFILGYWAAERAHGITGEPT